MDLEYTDRYHALWLPEPDPATRCTGACEGTGTVPVYSAPGVGGGVGTLAADPADGPTYRALWELAEQEQPSADGWHLVMCLDCHGTGRREA